MSPDDPITDHDVVDAMIRFGGSFVRRLGDAYLAADHENALKLRTAFPEYWQTYTEVAQAYRQRQAEKAHEP